jgi:biopolymer transport protein ExbB
VLWYALGYRFMSLQRGSVRSVRVLVERTRAGSAKAPRGVLDSAVVQGLDIVRRHARYDGLRRLLDDAFASSEADLRRGRILIASIIAVAPLAGLLGTVTGMIETFDSLGDMSLYSQSGGIAGGISQALFTTQMSLSIAVPGLIAGKVDVLPSVSAVYGFTPELELRGAVSQTLARPQLRELAPFQFADFFALPARPGRLRPQGPRGMWRPLCGPGEGRPLRRRPRRRVLLGVDAHPVQGAPRAGSRGVVHRLQ